MSVGNFIQAVLSVPITTAGVVITLSPAVAPYSLPPVDGGTLILADSVARPAAYEIITYTSRSGMNLTGVARGQEGTAPRDWPVGTFTYQSLTSGMYGQKVDVVPGKGLSEAELTTLEKTKLGNIAAGATNNPDTASLPENGNLYFTPARVLATVLNGLSLLTGSAVVATDTILIGVGKLQKQLTDMAAAVALKASKGVNGDITSLTGLTTPLSQAQGGTGSTDGRLNLTNVKVTSPASGYGLQGMAIGWNPSGLGNGEFVVNKGGGSGGFTFRTVNADNTVSGPAMTYSADGVLTIQSLAMTTPLTLAQGGTGGNSQASAQTALGLVPTGSTSPTTLGRLLKVGDYGLGGNLPLLTVNIDDLNSIPFGRIYAQAASTGTKPTGGAVQGFVDTFGYFGDGVHQIWTDVTGGSASMKVFQRDKFNTGAWSAWEEISGNKVKKTGDTMTGTLFVPQIEIGAAGSAGYTDFHSGANYIDYDSRIAASGGNGTPGYGSLTYLARGGHYFDGLITGVITSAQSLSGQINSSQVNGLDNALAGKMPTGGGGRPTFVSISVNQSPTASSQGVSMGWNESGDGAAAFINNQGGGSGGFVFRNVNSGNTVETGRITFTGDGKILANGNYIQVQGNGVLWNDGNVSGTAWGGFLSNWINQNFLNIGNLMPQIAAQNTANQIGSYAFCGNLSGSNLGFGGRVSGSSLRVADVGNANGGAPGGSWMSMGIGNNGSIGLYFRYA